MFDVNIRPWQANDFPTIQYLSDLEGWPTPSSRPTEALYAWQHSHPALVAVYNQKVCNISLNKGITR
jgi:hypothetical protein